MSDCLFCAIAAGEIPADVVYETETTMAFRDVNPQAPTHILVIPRTHQENVAEVVQAGNASAGELMATVTAVAKAEGLDTHGYRIVSNTGASAGQSVFHCHIHVLGGRMMQWPPG